MLAGPALLAAIVPGIDIATTAIAGIATRPLAQPLLGQSFALKGGGFGIASVAGYRLNQRAPALPARQGGALGMLFLWPPTSRTC